MKKIDLYILKKYFLTFFFCLLLFTVIVVVVDISEKTDDFAKSNLSVWRIFNDYYLGFIPRIVAMLFPLFVFIAVIFFTSKMASRTEVVAILSSGVSFHRFLLPFVAGGIVLSAVLWLGYQYIVPKANKKWGDFEAKYIDPNFDPSASGNTYKQRLYFRIDSNTYAVIRGYDTVTRNGNGFSLQVFDKTKMIKNIRAANISWDTTNKRNKWKLDNVVERTIHNLDETVKTYTTMYANYNFKPRDLRRDEYMKDQLPTPELTQFIKEEKMRGSETVNSLLMEKYNRSAIPVSVLVLTLIGGIIASRKVRGGSGIHLAIGVVLSVVYILFGRFAQVFASQGNFPPLIAAWLPNAVFISIAVYLYWRAPK